jgi:hypothetical protein
MAGEEVTDAELQAELTDRMAVLARIVDAPVQSLPGFTPKDSAIPFVQITDGELHWITVERGQELEHRTTRDQDTWLFWIFDGVTRDQAWSWERETRIAYVPSRLSAFCRHLELLARLDEGWAETVLAHYHRTLIRSPYGATENPRGVRGVESLRFLAEQIRGGAPGETAEAEAIIRAYGRDQPLTREQEAFATAALIASERVLHGTTSPETMRAIDPWVRRLLQD